jgi:T5SS/PEP-CTERM-associated repeat protein
MDFYVGHSGSGTLNIETGGQVNNSLGYLGYNSSSTGTATVTGISSMWTNSGTLYVGRSGSGTLNIQAGGQVSNTECFLGYFSTSTGTATVTGTGSTWINSGDLRVGFTGSGTLTVENGGLVTARSILAAWNDLHGDGTITVKGACLDEDLIFDNTHGIVKVLAFGTGGTLILNVDGTGFLGAGYGAAGTLLIADGLEIASSGGELGNRSGSNGTATVTGTGSTWTNSGNLLVGRSGTGTLNIQAGGKVSNSVGSLGNGSGSTGTATVTGTGSIWINSRELSVGSSGGGTLNIQAGGQVSNTSGFLGDYGIISTGTAMVTGTGSKWTNSNDLYVGDFGSGKLTVADGGLVEARTLFAAPKDLSGNGTIAAKGAILDSDLVFDGTHGLSQSLAFGTGGALNLNVDGTGDLGSGHKGTGTLRVADGITVASSTGIIGNLKGSDGTVAVTGTGSNWTISDGFYVGRYGKGKLNVADGGQVSNSFCYLGYGSGSNGTATVTGTGSIWTNSLNLSVGLFRSGTLIVQAGGQVSSLWGFIGSNSGSNGTATVTGMGSKWSISNDLYVGSSGKGKLIVADGGQVSARSLSVNTSTSSMRLHVNNNGMIVLGVTSTQGSLTNKGSVNFYADAYLPAGTYTPIYEYAGRAIAWSGTGTYNGIGGTWDNVAKNFVVSAPTALLAGDIDTISTAERMLFTDTANGKRTGASFGVVVGTPTFSAAWMTAGQLSDLAATPGFAGSVLAAWDYTTTLTGSEAMLSFDIGLGAPDIAIWHLHDGTWSPFTPDLETYDSHGILSFTTTELSGFAVAAVPEPASLVLVIVGGLLMVGGIRGLGVGGNFSTE